MNDVDINQAKPSTCYGCGQIIRNYSFLVCSECLDTECEKFATLVVSSIEREVEMDE